MARLYAVLSKIEDSNLGTRIIHVIRDNAACHKGADVRAFRKRPLITALHDCF